MRSTRAEASGGIERLLWGDHPARQTPGGPPQLHMVYSTEEKGTVRMLVVNLHGTKANLVFSTYLAAANFFVTSDVSSDQAMKMKPRAEERTITYYPEAVVLKGKKDEKGELVFAREN